jgi:hypothetical protein
VKTPLWGKHHHAETREYAGAYDVDDQKRQKAPLKGSAQLADYECRNESPPRSGFRVPDRRQMAHVDEGTQMLISHNPS